MMAAIQLRIWSSCLLSKNIKIKVHIAIILPAFCIGVKPCISPKVKKKKHGLRVFEKRELWRFIICTLQQVL
jgi:hypothetical protein